MKLTIIFLLLLFYSCTNSNKFYGRVYDFDTGKPIKNVHVDINGRTSKTDSTGYFCIKIKLNMKSEIYLKKEGYFSKKIIRKPDSRGRFRKEKINLDTIYLYNKQSDFYNKEKSQM